MAPRVEPEVYVSSSTDLKFEMKAFDVPYLALNDITAMQWMVLNHELSYTAEPGAGWLAISGGEELPATASSAELLTVATRRLAMVQHITHPPINSPRLFVCNRLPSTMCHITHPPIN